MNIYESITAIMSESIVIGKDKLNKQQGFQYRGIDDVMNTFYPLFGKYKIFIVPEVLEQTREERVSKGGGNLIYSILKVKYTFYAEDGSSISATVVGEGMDSADKASNKALAVAMKYAMFQVFCIPTEEFVDPDSETPPESKKKPEPKPEPPKVFGDMTADEPILTLEEAGNLLCKNRAGEDVFLKDCENDKLELIVKCGSPKLKEAANILLTYRAGLKK